MIMKTILRNKLIDIICRMLMWVAIGFVSGVILTLTGITSFF